jgi:glucokinase
VLGGRIYRGSTGAAAELGHTIIGASPDDAARTQDGFPRRGSLEALAAGRELDRIAVKIASERPDSQLAELAAKDGHVDGRDIVRLAHEGDADAVGALRVLGERLGIGVANAINTFDPDEVVIGGGVSAAGDLLLDPAREAAARFVLPGVGQRTRIRVARHRGKAGVRGAALLAALELAAGEEAFAPPRGEIEAAS